MYAFPGNLSLVQKKSYALIWLKILTLTSTLDIKVENLLWEAL